MLGRLRELVHEQTAAHPGMTAAVILMAYGSPDRLEDVPAYYADIRGGRPIAPEHLADLVARYGRLGIEESNPLNEITEATGRARGRARDPVFTGMRHWQPRIADAVERALQGGAEELVGLVLAPHYSGMSIGRYRAQLEAAVGDRAELRFVERWGAEPGYVELLAERLRLRNDKHVVFTAHSLPSRILDDGDPYRDELLVSSRLVAERAGAASGRSPSRASRRPGSRGSAPDILEHLNELAANDVRDVLLCPIGFVADHLEIRWDLDVEAVDRARELGLRLERIELPNADPAFVRVLAGLVRGTPRYRPRGEDGPDPGRRGLAPLPRPCERGAQPQGALRARRPHRARRTCRRSGTACRSRSSPARRSVSSAATAPASRRCCG